MAPLSDLGAPWAVCTVANLAIVAGAIGWIVSDHTRDALTSSGRREELGGEELTV